MSRRSAPGILQNVLRSVVNMTPYKKMLCIYIHSFVTPPCDLNTHESAVCVPVKETHIVESQVFVVGCVKDTHIVES